MIRHPVCCRMKMRPYKSKEFKFKHLGFFCPLCGYRLIICTEKPKYNENEGVYEYGSDIPNIKGDDNGRIEHEIKEGGSDTGKTNGKD